MLLVLRAECGDDFSSPMTRYPWSSCGVHIDCLCRTLFSLHLDYLEFKGWIIDLVSINAYLKIINNKNHKNICIWQLYDLYDRHVGRHRTSCDTSLRCCHGLWTFTNCCIILNLMKTNDNYDTNMICSPLYILVTELAEFWKGTHRDTLFWCDPSVKQNQNMHIKQSK